MSESNSPPLRIESKAGTSAVLYHVVFIQPATVDEVHNAIGESVGREQVYASLTKLYRSGFLLRRERESDGHGPNPYEYAIRDYESFTGGESNE